MRIASHRAASTTAWSWGPPEARGVKAAPLVSRGADPGKGDRRPARFDCVQPRYNILYRDIERELLPLCADQGIGVIVYNPLAGGMLTGKYSREKPPPADSRMGLRAMYRQRYWHERNFAALDRLRPVAARHGHSLVQLALAWVLSRPAITSAIVGATSPEQLRQSLSAVGLTVSDEEMQACNELWEDLRGRDPSPR